MRGLAGVFRPMTRARRFCFVAVVLSVCACAPAAALIGKAGPAAQSVPLGTRTAPPFRYIYDSDSAPAAAVSSGWNLIDVGSKWSADQLPAQAKGLIWVGDYDNNSCSWEMTDAELKSQVAEAVGDPKVFGYLFSDEPNPYACPSAPAQHKARSVLIHSIDARTRSVVVLDSNGFKGRATPDSLDQLPLWKGAADVIGLDPYPCYQGLRCDFSWIDKTIHGRIRRSELLGRRPGIQRLELALADPDRVVAHARSVGGLEGDGLHDVRLGLGRQPPCEQARPSRHPEAVQCGRLTVAVRCPEGGRSDTRRGSRCTPGCELRRRHRVATLFALQQRTSDRAGTEAANAARARGSRHACVEQRPSAVKPPARRSSASGVHWERAVFFKFRPLRPPVNPPPSAAATACAWLCTPNFIRMFWTCTATVL